MSKVYRVTKTQVCTVTWSALIYAEDDTEASARAAEPASINWGEPAIEALDEKSDGEIQVDRREGYRTWHSVCVWKG